MHAQFFFQNFLLTIIVQNFRGRRANKLEPIPGFVVPF